MPDRFHTDTVSGATSQTAPDATTSATPAFERGSDSVSGQSVADASHSRQSDGKDESLVDGSSASVDEVQDLIDAVAGATWSTRNRIMEERFHSALEKGTAKVPTFKPPGESIES